jgi:DNA polymerase-1
VSAVLLVDGMSIFKSTAGPAAHLQRGHAYSFLLQLTATIKKLKPSAVIVCWEGGKGGREKIYDGYKGERTTSSEEVRSQRAELQELLVHLGVEQAVCPGYEGDDVIASLANTLPTPVIILSNDKDFLQLVSDRVRVYQRPRMSGAKSKELIGPHNFEACTGYSTPKLWAMGQFALGDGVDGVPKVTGMTPAKVHSFLHGMHVTPKVQERMEQVFYEADPEYMRNKALMDLRRVKELPEPLKITYGKLSAESAVRVLYELGFASIVAKFHEWFAAYEGCTDADVSA